MILDKEARTILSIAAFTIVVFLITATWLFSRFESRRDLCQERGGIMLKSPEGWLCVDAKVLK